MNTKKEKWQEAANLEDLHEEVPSVVSVGKRKVLLLLSEGRVTAVAARCPHYGAMLDKGVLIDHVLTCPKHAARFDVESGGLLFPPAFEDLKRYSVKVEKGMVYVRQDEKPRPRITIRPESGTFIIVGGGGAGCAAALTLRREGFDGRVIIATAEQVLPYDRPNLTKDYLAGELERKWMDLKPEEFYEDSGIEIRTGSRLIYIKPEEKSLHFAGGEYMEYDRLLLATGGIPRTPDIPGVWLENFFLLRSMADVDGIIASLEGAGRVLVIGASFIGLETASALRKRGIEVHVAAPEKIPMTRIFGEKTGLRIMKLHEEQGVVFHLGAAPEEITGHEKVNGAVLSDGSRIDADVVIAGIGIVPAVNYIEDGDVAGGGGIAVDGNLRTVLKDVYAAGDIAALPDPVTGTVRRVEHWAEALGQGMHAARAMLGAKEEYSEVPFFWTKQYDTVIKYVGYAPSYDSIVYRGNPDDGDFIAGFYDHGKLLAAAAIGRMDDLVITASIIKSGIQPSMDLFGDESADLRSVLESGKK